MVIDGHYPGFGIRTRENRGTHLYCIRLGIMNQIWIVVVVLVGLVIFTRLRNRRSTRPKVNLAPGPKISGSQVIANLHPRMSTACLFDHGVQFGRGFRRKEGPEIPHGESCKCEVIAFSFSSNEVFNGALRKFGEIRGEAPELPVEDMERLIARMKEIESTPVDGDRATYLESMGLESIPNNTRPEWERFLSERHDYLLEIAGENTRERKKSDDGPEESHKAAHLPEQRFET